MLDDKDIELLSRTLATKQDFANLSLNLLSKEEFEIVTKEIKDDINDLREQVQALVVAVDKLVGAVSDLKQEYAMASLQMSRHEKWIKQIAEKLGMKLEY